MRTARLLPISPSMHCSWGVYLVPEGVYLPRGVYLVLLGVPTQGGVPGPGGCTWSWEVPGG